MKYEVETDEAIHKWTDKTKKYRSEDTDQRIQIREYRSENTDHRIIKRESSENQARIPATIIGLQSTDRLHGQHINFPL